MNQLDSGIIDIFNTVSCYRADFLTDGWFADKIKVFINTFIEGMGGSV
jgi:hypothetical protein